MPHTQRISSPTLIQKYPSSIFPTNGLLAPPSNNSPSLHRSRPSRLGKNPQTKLVRHKKEIHKQSNHIHRTTRKSYTSTSNRPNGSWSSSSCSRNSLSIFRTNHF